MKTPDSLSHPNTTVVETVARKSKLIPELFAEQANLHPNRLAIDAVNGKMTFSTLEYRTRLLTQRLLEHGVEKDTVVAVVAPRDTNLIEALLAVWRAGAAFLLLDPNDPHDLSLYKLKVTAARIVICTAPLVSKWRAAAQSILVLDDTIKPKSAVDNKYTLPEIAGRSLAYVVFTSGSTGRPKGVMIEHTGLAEHLATQLAPHYDTVSEPNTSLRIAVSAPVSFDSFIDQVLPMVALGHTLVLFDEHECIIPDRFLDGGSSAVDVVDCTPSLLTLLVNHGLLKRKKRLRLIIFGGESPSQYTWDQIRKSSIPAVSIYGATECTIGSMEADVHEYERVNLGFPAGSASVYVLDEDGHVVPPGIVGEICLAGPGVGRGYVALPDETARSFVRDHFCQHANARMYRTGDMGKMDSSGRLYFCGRLDDQVKIRGFRIELGEVEAALLSIPEIHQAAVIPVPYNGAATHLVAFFVGSPDLDWLMIRERIAQRLPYYMVPAHVIRLQELPLTRHGKVDRRHLADLDRATDRKSSLIPPANQLEAWILDIWQDVLKRKQIGVVDAFESVGGHSLTAIEIITRIQAEFNHPFDIKAALATHTIREMAIFLAQASNSFKG